MTSVTSERTDPEIVRNDELKRSFPNDIPEAVSMCDSGPRNIFALFPSIRDQSSISSVFPSQKYESSEVVRMMPLSDNNPVFDRESIFFTASEPEKLEPYRYPVSIVSIRDVLLKTPVELLGNFPVETTFEALFIVFPAASDIFA